MRKFALCLFCALLIAPAVLAQIFIANSKPSETLPSVIVDGLETYRTSSPEAAIRSWSKGGPLDGSQEASNQAVLLHQIQESYGAFQGFGRLAVWAGGPNLECSGLPVILPKNSWAL